MFISYIPISWEEINFFFKDLFQCYLYEVLLSLLTLEGASFDPNVWHEWIIEVLNIIYKIARIPDGPRFVYSGVYGTSPPLLNCPPQPSPSTKMSGMSGFELSEA